MSRWKQIRSQMPTTLADLINDVGLDKARAQLETQWRVAVKIVDAKQVKVDEERAELYRRYPDFDTEEGKRRYWADWAEKVYPLDLLPSILTTEQRQERITELKGIMQSNHPDKGYSADMSAFHAAAEELRLLRS